MLGNAGKKISRIVDLAETLYEKVVELRGEVAALRETAEETRDRVVDLESEVAEQRAVLEALAEAEGVDVEAVTADGSEEPAEAASGAER